MEGRGAQVAHDCALGLDNRHGYFLLGQQQRDAEPDRPAAGDDHLGVADAGDRAGMRWMCSVACHIVALPSRVALSTVTTVYGSESGEEQ